jgi:eukaryotic-like serine/threonine-protein kinase
MLRRGDRLGGRYELIEEIAAGGMGRLWRAHHVELDVDVALKVVSTQGATPGSFKRFKREAQAAARLRSPNIVQVLDYGEFDGQPYLAMELLQGEDLAKRLARAGRLPFDDCTKIIDGLAKGVQLAHDAGIVHRDLKPGNIFLERVGDEEIVKILDFGVAKDLATSADPGSTTAGGVVMGSPAYMSPEQVWAHQVGHRADLWAMGVVAFEMLIGKNPFSDETLAKIFERIVRAPLPKPSEFEQGLPPELDAFFARALARAPKERIASAKEFAEGFRAAIDGRDLPPRRHDSSAETQPAATGLPGVVTERRRPLDAAPETNRRRSVLLLSAALAFALAIGIGIAAQPRITSEETDPGAPELARPKASAAVQSPRPEVPAASTAMPAVDLALDQKAAPSSSSSPQTAPRKRAPASAHRQPNSAKKSGTTPSSPDRDPDFGIPLKP